MCIRDRKKDKCEKQAIDNEFAIELDKDELKMSLEVEVGAVEDQDFHAAAD